MDLEQMRLKLAEVLAKIETFEEMEDFTQEQLEEIEGLNAEFGRLSASIKVKENIAAAKATVDASSRKAPAAAAPAVQVGDDRKNLDPKAGWKASGEFFGAVVNACAGGSVDKRLLNAGAKERIGEDGGYLIPGEFRTEIQKKVTGDESLISRTNQFLTSQNSMTVPTSETAPWDGTGIQAFWEDEGATHQSSKAKFGSATIKLNKLTALVRVTDELLDDAPALESYIRANAPEAMLHKVNSAIIGGDGVGKPLGFLNSGFKYKVAKVSMQSADTVLFANVNAMYGRMIPSSIPYSVWLVNPAVLPLLPLMKFDDAADSPVPVYLPATGVSGAPYGTLYGRPIVPMMGGVKALGDEGDISLVDLRYYTSILKTTGIKSDISAHVYFNSSETAFRFTMRVGGQVLYKSPVSTENGNFQMSGIVTLEDR